MARSKTLKDPKKMNISLDGDIKATLLGLARQRRTTPSQLISQWVLREHAPPTPQTPSPPGDLTRQIVSKAARKREAPKR